MAEQIKNSAASAASAASAGAPIGWRKKFFKTVPVRDAQGNAIPDNPALNTNGFWKRPEHKRFDRPGERKSNKEQHR